MAALHQRNRIIYGSTIILTIILGLLIRKNGTYFPSFIATYAPDTLWAMMVFWIMGFLFPNKKTLTTNLYALLFSYGIEISQLYQAEWINSIRHTTLGGLILGFGFLWSDIVAYTIGILIGTGIENWMILKK